MSKEDLERKVLLIKKYPDVHRHTDGDFLAEVQEDALVVPKTVYDYLLSQNIRNVEEFLSYVHAFPSSIALAMNWTPEQVKQAHNRLVSKLVGIVDYAILFPKPHTKPASGAKLPYREGRRIN